MVLPPAEESPAPGRPSREPTLTIHEIYASIQGESTWAGLPCVFVRTTFCDLRCSWCDTAHAFYHGEKMTLPLIVERALSYDVPLVELTGGEPLLQPNALPLMAMLCDAGRTVLLETSGAHDISRVDPRVHRIMDLKAPDSGECARNRWENLPHLNQRDEVKIVLSSRADYEWARDVIRSRDFAGLVRAVLLSCVFGRLDPRQVVEWMLADRLPARFQLQMHKFIWPPDRRGV